MTRINSRLCAGVAATALILTFTLAPPILAAANPKGPTPPTATPQERASQDAMQAGRRDCKKIYEYVHRGHPGKGTDQLKLVRVECPTPRA